MRRLAPEKGDEEVPVLATAGDDTAAAAGVLLLRAGFGAGRAAELETAAALGEDKEEETPLFLRRACGVLDEDPAAAEFVPGPEGEEDAFAWPEAELEGGEEAEAEAAAAAASSNAPDLVVTTIIITFESKVLAIKELLWCSNLPVGM